VEVVRAKKKKLKKKHEGEVPLQTISRSPILVSSDNSLQGIGGKPAEPDGGTENRKKNSFVKQDPRGRGNEKNCVGKRGGGPGSVKNKDDTRKGT